MKINEKDSVAKTKDGKWWYLITSISNDWIEASEDEIPYVEEIYKTFRKRGLSDSYKNSIFETNKSFLEMLRDGGEVQFTANQLLDIAQKIIDFFVEFHFEPNFRFINTLAKISKSSVSDACEYVVHYFELSDSPFTTSIEEKMRSTEFQDLMGKIRKLPVTKKINKRFKLYYGSQGTGKTTVATEESDGNCMVCHSAMLPQDLMEDFKFIDGNATFTPSILYRAMLEGKVITLDEINLLPFESLRFLQTILDGKEEFNYKGNTVKIADGFKIIGTMNLVVNGAVYSLPEPLIDRAEDLRCFKLTASDLVGAFN